MNTNLNGKQQWAVATRPSTGLIVIASVMLIGMGASFGFGVGYPQSDSQSETSQTTSDGQHKTVITQIQEFSSLSFDDDLKPVVLRLEKSEGENGEIVVRINGELVQSNDWFELEQRVLEAFPGQAVQFLGRKDSVIRSMPRTMIGVMMQPIEGAIASQLQIEPGSAVILERVIEGMPGYESGLRQHDVVYHCDGYGPPLTRAIFSEILSKANPGDPLNLHVIRGGQRIELGLVLKEYDPAVIRDHSPASLANATLSDVDPSGAELLVNTPSFSELAGLFETQGFGAANSNELLSIDADGKKTMFFAPNLNQMQLGSDTFSRVESQSQVMHAEIHLLRQQVDRMSQMIELLLVDRFANSQSQSKFDFKIIEDHAEHGSLEKP